MKLYEILEKQLKKEINFVSDNGELKKWVVINRAQNFDEELIELLLKNETLKEKFFVKVKDVLVFKQNLFIEFLEQKNYLNDSYTKYKNKVGLTIDGKFLKQRNEVALVWPFKDCILEGGQSREEQKREEIFFNEILAQDEITQLLEPKVLTNAKRIDKDDEKPLDGFKRDAEINRKRGLPDDTITDNLIIKGNNLLALHSLKKEFAGKVKLIYIDPPYNTGNDSFKYNDSFNHSAWLTFIKNRLTSAKALLKEDGAIVISCDDHEQAYLKVLLDEVFGNDNFLVNGVVNRASEIASNFSISKHEYFLVYAKNIRNFKLKSEEKYTISRGTVGNPTQTMPVITFPAGLICKGVKDGEYKTTRKIEGGNENIENLDPIIVKNGRLYKPVRLKARWRRNDMRNFFNNNCEPTVAKINGIIEEIYFEGDRFMPYIKKRVTEKIPSLIEDNKRGSKDLEKLQLSGQFKYPKSVGFIKQLISYFVSGNDIVLDFFAGSGTTAHAVLELNKEDGGNRQFILCEQMDYVETVTCKRIKKVIEKDNLSTNFVYLELKKYNQTFMEQIEEAQDTETLLQIWEQMKAKSFFKYSVDLRAFENSLEEFKQFDLPKQKQLLCELLDKNQLYVNLSSLNDTDFACTDEEKKVTKDFYQLKNK